MRLGGPILEKCTSPEQWVQVLRSWGYRAALAPISAEADREEIAAYRRAAAEADIVIAEVGAWSNPLSSDPQEAAKALEYCKRQLALADELGALCCVNISGSRGPVWDGPHPENYADDTFDLVVQQVRDIIDTVKPQTAFYTLEPMPWMVPDSPDSYLQLLTAVDRPQFAVHLDVVNWISSPKKYLRNGAFIKECFSKLGPYIKSCHAKDTILHGSLTTHLEETAPGKGHLDYRALLKAMDQLHPDTPLILEHLETPEEYQEAGTYVRNQASAIGLTL